MVAGFILVGGLFGLAILITLDAFGLLNWLFDRNTIYPDPRD